MKNQIVNTQKLLRLPTVQEELAKLLFHFPGNGRTVDGLAVISPDYLDKFKGLYESEFVELVTIAIETRRFFPTIADLVQIELEADLRNNYNPYGGAGNIPSASEATQELTDMTQEPPKEMSKENKDLLAKFIKNIGEEI